MTSNKKMQQISNTVRKLLNKIRPHGGKYDPLPEKITKEDEGIDDLPDEIYPGDDEGRGIGQEMYDAAPGISLAFSHTDGQADMVDAIRKMSNNGG